MIIKLMVNFNALGYTHVVLISAIALHICTCQVKIDNTVSSDNTDPFAQGCEAKDTSGVTVYNTCFTEVQQLLRSRNVLRSVEVTPTNGTCGRPSSKYCRLDDQTDDCMRVCDAEDPLLSHPASLALDSLTSSWWQSVTWTSYPQPLHISYTVSFHKLYRLTDDLVITFDSGRPKEMIIERSVDNGVSWQVWQYYSKDCITSFNITPTALMGDDPQRVICSQVYSDLLPYSGGQVVFDVLSRYQIYLGAEFNDVSTLYQSYNDTNWQRFLQFSDIRIRLLHPATDGEELIAGVNLLKYYYAISHVEITAVCSCNLHASTCSIQDGRTVCDCQHNTAGDNCERCLPLYNNREWNPGYYVPVGSGPANECQACECHGHSDVCEYNHTLGYGVCIACRDNTVGMSCDLCADGYYANSSLPLNSKNICIDCGCNINGTVDGKVGCDSKGVCRCKENVIGDKCDKCSSHFYGLQTHGQCSPCYCSEFGVVPRTVCDGQNGQCRCKNTTVGRTCSQCTADHYGFPIEGAEECSPCSCTPGSSVNSSCSVDTGQCHCLPSLSGRVCDVVTPGHYLPSPISEYTPDSTTCSPLYEVESAEESDQWLSASSLSRRLSVDCSENESVTFRVRVTHSTHSSTSRSYVLGVKYKSASNTTLMAAISTDATCGEDEDLSINVTLAESSRYYRHLSEQVLSLSSECVYLVTLTQGGSSSIVIGSLTFAAYWSQFDIYDLMAMTSENASLCYDWVNNKAANEFCRLLVHSSMSELYGATKDCGCNPVGSIPNTSCDPYGGQCQCRPGVKGRSCDQCLLGYYNLTAQGCTRCSCDMIGSEHAVCDPDTGQCVCRSLVATYNDMDYFGNSRTTLRCESCVYGSYLLSKDGCTNCNCNLTGSVTPQCRHRTGDCQCKSGVGGANCDQCLPDFYQFNQSGCRSCDCDSRGSTSSICDVKTGQCLCKDNTQGRTCDVCKIGTFGLSQENTAGCSPCYCSSHSNSDCQSSGGFYLTRVFYSDVTSLRNDWEFPSLLSSYGHIIRFFVMSSDSSISFGDAVLSIVGSSSPNASSTELQYQMREAAPLATRIEVNAPLIESDWIIKSTNAPPAQSQFLHILSQQLSIKFVPSIEYIAVSITIATKQEVMSSAEPYLGVENCTCSGISNTKGLSCENCKEGYQRADVSLSSLSDCTACECSNRTDGPPLCHPVSGICENCRFGTTGGNCESCDENVTGSTCSVCEDGYWGLHTVGKCIECHCDVIGSINSTCDQLTGRCYCKVNVEGEKCTSCLLNHHQLSAEGCTRCHECYSLVGDKVGQVDSIAEDINVFISQLANQLPVNTNLTFSESINIITSQLFQLTQELTMISNYKENITSTLSEWRSMSYNFSLSPQPTSGLAEWNTTLITLNNSLRYYQSLSEWLEQKLLTDTTRLSDLTVEIANQSVVSFSEELSILDSLVKLSGNITLRLQSEANNLSLIQADIVAADHLCDDVTTNLTNSVSSITFIQEKTTSILASLSNINKEVLDKRTQINQSLQLIDEYIAAINQSLVSTQQNQPITANYTLFLNNTKVIAADISLLVEKLDLDVEKFKLLDNTSAGFQSMVDKVYNMTVQLSVAAQRHLVEIKLLQGEVMVSVDSLNSDYSYLTEVVGVMTDFQSRLTEIKGAISNSLTLLSELRNSTALLANNTKHVAEEISRVHGLAAMLYAEGNDLYNQAMLQKKVLISLNTTAFQLASRMDNMPTDDHQSMMNTVLDDIAAVHNTTCKALANHIETLKIRHAELQQKTDSQKLEVVNLGSQVLSIESLLEVLESDDHTRVEDLTQMVMELSASADALSLSALVGSLEECLVSQRLLISEAEHRLGSIEHSLLELESLQ